MTSTGAATAFDRAIAVVPGPTATTAIATIDPAWGAPTGPNGGYLAATVVRAIELLVDPDDALRLRSLTLHYLRGAGPGPLEVEVEALRRGRRITSLRIAARQDDRPILAGLAALAVPGIASPVAWGPVSPAPRPAPARDAGLVPVHEYRPDAGRWMQPVPQMPPIVHEVRFAPQLGGVPLAGRVPDPGGAVETGGWVSLPEPRRIDAALVALALDVWWPPVFEAVTRPVIAPTIDLTIHFRADVPRAGLDGDAVFGLYRSTSAGEGMVEEDARVFGEDGTLLAESRQLALLVAAG
jgi:acyl-CoA thioesterase